MSNYLVDYWWVPFLILSGLILISIVVQFFIMEYKPGEPSTKCECGFEVYLSSMDEHLKTCEAKV